LTHTFENTEEPQPVYSSCHKIATLSFCEQERFSNTLGTNCVE
jgi:hypothetical protein